MSTLEYELSAHPKNDSTTCHVNDGDTAWVLICTVLVLGMCPGLAFFEAGLLRMKNTLSIISQILSGIVILSVLWDIIGYSLVYDSTHGKLIGGVRYYCLAKVSYSECSPHAPNVPAGAFAIFQMMFAVISPLLMTGAFAERVGFRAFIVICVAWEVLVYYPLAHWIWGDGWLGANGLGALDFAGGIVIHTSAGASSLIAALYLGRRRHFEVYEGEFPTSNLPLAAVGAGMLWMGWFGFNAGSALASGSVAVSTVVSTQVAGSLSGFVWLVLLWIHDKPSTVGLLNGVIAGLAGITPASGYIDTPSSLILALVLGLSSYYSIKLLKHKLHIDDALDVSSVHGVTGMLGSLTIGIASQKSLNPNGEDGLIVHGSPHLLGVQTLAVVVAAAWAGFWTAVILWVTDKVIGVRISAEEEEQGIDAVYHGEFAYHNMLLPDQVPLNTSKEDYKKLMGTQSVEFV